LTIGGSVVSLSLYNAWPVQLSLRYQSYSTLTIQRRGGALPGLPDPWLGKPVILSIGGVNYFQGDVVSVDPSFGSIGWINIYQCLDLKRRCDLVPMTDSNTLTDSAAYNLSPEDVLAIPSRQGRNVGQILTDVLTMVDNAKALNAHGVGAYSTLTPPTLPASTVADLATLTVIPPSGVYIQGEKLIGAIEAFARFWAPNYLVWIEPAGGAIRFIDKRVVSGHTFTMGTDPVDPTMLRRSIQDNFQRVVVRGQSIAEPKLVTLLTGGLAEDFAWGTNTNAAAKAAWTPDSYRLDLQAKSNGTCTCTDTLDVVVKSADAAQAWVANYWDQTATGHLGQIYLYASVATGINMYVSRRIVSNAAMVAAGTANVQLDLALPATNYDHYSIYGISTGSGMVWRKYKVVDMTIAAAMARQFTYPAVWIGSGGGSAVATNYPMGSVCFSSSGNPPYQEWPSWFTIDPSTAHIYFQVPTYITCGNHTPSDVRALLAVNTGHLTAIYPADTAGTPPTPNYGGTSHTVDGLSDTLTVTVGQWRDPINQTNMVAFAHDLFDSVSDTIVEGSVVFHGLYLPGLTPGLGLSVTGRGYTTGWEGLNLTVTECELTWNHGEPAQYTTVMNCSNRRAHFSAEAFMRPDRLVGGQMLGTEDQEGWNPFRVMQPSFAMMYQMGAARQQRMVSDYLTPSIDQGDADFTAGLDLKEYRKHGRTQTYAEQQKQAQHAAAQQAQQEHIMRAQENRLQARMETRDAFATQQEIAGAGFGAGGGFQAPLTREQQQERREGADYDRWLKRQTDVGPRNRRKAFEERQDLAKIEDVEAREG
jgi:hypothetical protein